jgi:hypothetical protein
MFSQFVRRLVWLAAATALCGHSGSFSKCDILHQGTTDIADVQAIINEALGVTPAVNDLNGDGVVNIVDVQIVIDAALGLGCLEDPGITSIVPNTGQPGASGINVTISGRLTNFSNNSVINLGAGITVTNVAASNATTLTATLAIAANAAYGATTLTVDGLTLANAFTVTQPVSVSYTYDSQDRLSTATYILASGGVRTVTYTYDAAGNRTAVVAQ